MKEKHFYLADFFDGLNKKPIRFVYVFVIILTIYFTIFFLASTFLYITPSTYPEQDYVLLEETMDNILNIQEKRIEFSNIPSNVEYAITSKSNNSIEITIETKEDNYFSTLYSVTISPDFKVIKSYRAFGSLDEYKNSAKLSAYIFAIPNTLIILVLILMFYTISKYRKELYFKNNQKKSEPSILIKASGVLKSKD